MDAAKHIAELIGPAAEDLGYELVRITFGGDRKPKLQIMAERQDGQMGIEDCERLSREVSAILDVADPISSDYVLEVSSPGIDRPLTRPKDFARYIGFDAKITASQQINGQRRFTGVLNSINDAEIIEIETAEGRIEIPFALVEKAKLILTDKLLKAHEGTVKKQEQ